MSIQIFGDGSVYPHDPADDVRSTGGVAIAQTDWNAAEGAPGHIKNMPAFEWIANTTVIEKDIIPEQTANVGWSQRNLAGKRFYCSGDLEWNNQDFEDGEIVALYVDGERYEVPVDVKSNIANTLDPYGGTIGEVVPFILDFSGGHSVGEGEVQFCHLTADSTHTVRMCSIEKRVNKIPDKFLPDGLPYCDESYILPETEFILDAEEGTFYAETAPDLKVGETYTVTWNGTEYTCVGQDASMLQAGTVALGNVNAFAPGMGFLGNDEPFIIASVSGMGCMAMALDYAEGDPAPIVSIRGVMVSKLDNRCLDLDWIPKVNKRILIPEVTVTSGTEAQDDGYYLSQVKFTIGFSIPVGTEIPLIMVVDGVEYSAVGAGSMDATSVHCPAVGLTFAHISDNYQLFASTEPATTYKVSVYDLAGSEYEKIPKIFLPEGVPYIEKGGMVEILPECQPMYVADDHMFIIEQPIAFVAGETYTVSWNGKEYSCVCQDMSAMQAGALALGDLSNFGGSGNGEPFTLATIPGSGVMIAPLDGSTTLTVAIYSDGKTYHKLDNRLLDLDWFPKLTDAVGDAVYPAGTITIPLGGQGTYSLQLDQTIDFEVGKEYIVNFDGVDYRCVAKYYPDDTNIVYLGNCFGDSDEPFRVITLNNGSLHHTEVVTDSFGESSSYTVSFGIWTVEKVAVDKMPETFLPESVDGVIIRSSTEGSTKKFKLTIDDSGTISATEVTA